MYAVLIIIHQTSPGPRQISNHYGARVGDTVPYRLYKGQKAYAKWAHDAVGESVVSEWKKS